MIRHIDFENNTQGNLTLSRLIRNGKITYAGNSSMKIYGILRCKSGKRMLRRNRVFFPTEKEAIQYGFRPCAHCMNKKYIEWKKNSHI